MVQEAVEGKYRKVTAIGKSVCDTIQNQHQNAQRSRPPLSVKKEPGDSLKAYNAKYWKTFNEILDCPTNLAITEYKRGLPVGHRLRDSLTMN